MANQFNNIKDAGAVFAQGIAERLRDNLVFCRSVDSMDASEITAPINGFKKGDTIYKSIPPRYSSQSDDLDITGTIQDSVEEKKPIVLNKTETIGMKMNSLELATDVDIKNALKRFGMPAADRIAHRVESRCLEIATDSIYNSVGTAGSQAYTVAEILAAGVKLDENLAPDERKLLMSSAAGAAAIDARKGLFQFEKESYKKGYIGEADGFDWSKSELVTTHTNGNDVAFEVRTTMSEGDSTVVVEGLTANTGTVTKGTVLTFASTYMVHPIDKSVTTVKQQVVVTADATADASGYATLSISPALYAASDGLQNVDVLPADGDAITPVGSASTGYKQALAYAPEAFNFVTAPLYNPKGVDLGTTVTVDGITVNLVRDFDVKTREVITRLDVLFAFDPIRQEWATRITA